MDHSLKPTPINIQGYGKIKRKKRYKFFTKITKLFEKMNTELKLDSAKAMKDLTNYLWFSVFR